MGRVVVSQFITVDGIVEDPGGSEGFERGGWAFMFDRGSEGDRFKSDELMASDALLLGRRTYEVFARAWPARSGEFADKFNQMPKHVASTTLRDPEWNNTTVIDGDVAAAVRRLKQELSGDILVNGSISLLSTLLDDGLVDELRLMLFPILLGAGKRPFGDGPEPIDLRLNESRPAGDTVILIYERAAVDPLAPSKIDQLKRAGIHES